MGNIILHIFLHDVRHYYDLETLWAIGEQFDDKLQRQEKSVITDIMDQHLQWIEQQAAAATAIERALTSLFESVSPCACIVRRRRIVSVFLFSLTLSLTTRSIKGT